MLLAGCPPLSTADPSLAENMVWYRIELFIYLTVIIVNMQFLGYRACCKNTESLDFSD
jgi:hypothetical protein